MTIAPFPTRQPSIMKTGNLDCTRRYDVFRYYSRPDPIAPRYATVSTLG